MASMHLRLSCLSLRVHTLLRQTEGLSSKLGVGKNLLCRELHAGQQLHSSEEFGPERDLQRNENFVETFKSRRRRPHNFSKVHNRVFTNKDKENERKYFEQDVMSVDSDTFGQLGKVESFVKSRRPVQDMEQSLGARLKEPTHFSPVEKKRVQKSWNTKERDTFGTLADEERSLWKESLTSEVGSHNERFQDDLDEEGKSHIRLSAGNRRHSQDWYGRKIEKFGKAGQIKEAVTVLEEWMLQNDRVMPTAYTFTVLIGVLGRVGYTKKAFQLFNKMKKMGLQPVDLTYTSLFNACANSPWSEDGLSRADNLRHLMQGKDYEPNQITYQAMIKCYALQGDIQTAFRLMDELTATFRPTAETFSFLLMACISDRKAGFKFTLKVWRLMKQFKVSPDLPLYNLLLRSVRDCGAGDNVFSDLLLQGQQEVDKLTPKSPEMLSQNSSKFVTSGKHEVIGRVSDEARSVQGHGNGNVSDTEQNTHDSGDCEPNIHQLERLSLVSTNAQWWEVAADYASSDISHLKLAEIPNLLRADCKLDQVISIRELKYPDERLAVIGGMHGILDAMATDGVQPDVRTFTQLIEVAPPTVDAEMALLHRMEDLGVRPDIALYNSLIRKRCFRRDAEGARRVLEQMMASGLQPDMMTFGTLAMTCRFQKDGMQFLKDMEHYGLSPNIEVLGTLAYASRLDFGYKLAILREVEKRDLSPNDKFVEVVERSIAQAKRRIVQVEKGLTTDNFLSSQYFQTTFMKFLDYYETWLRKTRPHQEPHPWNEFRKKVEKSDVSEARN
ncbi:pentatricopeptide repeat-containing protein 1, mitochondrial-like [Haliotis rufescens]|uniref:pentatricopeptide repeat-containing protein 1, mitochondrial-like n=1 Tax=Haliotis rufescens TaxID=6454 RepID=UPI00201ED7B6|nr:pentatricopeptide repeat-containing protein 1, mitochondrial-like [Haliotis rufescens]